MKSLVLNNCPTIDQQVKPTPMNVTLKMISQVPI